MGDLTRLSNSDLLERAKTLASLERRATIDLIIALREIDARKLYLSEGFPSMFVFCRYALHLSESAAYSRIEVARASRAFPELLEALRGGTLNPTTAMLLAPHLRADNADELIDAARFKTRREVETILAAVRPKPNVIDLIRKVPAPHAEPRAASGFASDASPSSNNSEPMLAPERPAPRAPAVVPLAPARYKVQFTADEDTHVKLRRAQSLLRHQIPDGDLCAVINQALTLLIERVERRRLGLVDRPRARSKASRPGSRYIPVGVRREVWERDEGRCAFVGNQGRCIETERLEFHHVVPFGAGGNSTAENIELRCRSHNQHEGVVFFGEEKMSRHKH